MGQLFKRPRNEEELKQLEASGLWKAQALAKDIGENGSFCANYLNNTACPPDQS